MVFGEKLRKLRQIRGYNCKQFCEAAGITWKTLQNYQSGTSQPNYTVLVNIREALDVSWSVLMDESEDVEIIIKNMEKESEALS